MDIISRIFLQEFIATLNKDMQKIADCWLMKGLNDEAIHKLTNFSSSKIQRNKKEIKMRYKNFRDNLNQD